MARLDKKDYEILDYIYEQSQLNGFPPTVREIGLAVGFTSTATVHSRIKKLGEAGYLEKESSKNRSLKVINYTGKGNNVLKNTEPEDKYIEVPMIGKVAAGMPISAIQQNTETFPLPMSFAKNKDLFMLKVQGDSMINAAILDGDYIIVRQQSTANNGDIVVALVNNREEATVKTFYREKNHFRLQPENDEMDPIIVDELSIVGVVTGVFRQF